MRCRNAKKSISEYVDGILDVGKKARLEKHFEDCASCRELEADLKTVSEAASRLDRPAPSGDVWARIRAGLTRSAADGAIPAKSRSRDWGFGWRSPAIRYAGAALVGLTLIAAGMFFGIRLGSSSPEPSFRERVEYTLAKLDEAEGYYMKAIESLNEVFASQQGALVPEVAEMFERNLQVIDASIQACRRAVLAEPNDLEARRFLLASYMEKVSFLNSVLEYPQRSPAVINSGRSL